MLWRILLSALFVVVLFGCASSGTPPIESRSQPPSQKINTYVVEPGDTLYSIAWRYEKDYKQLAAINDISAPYVIYRGQQIKLSGTAVAPSVVASSSRAATSVSTRAVTTRTTETRTATTSAPVPPASRAANSSSSASSSVALQLPDSVSEWQWPLRGKIVKSFGSSSLTKGITLDSSAEQNVRAAADGVVVYAGSGVRGYGNFLILKHSDLFLSAYAYNEQLLAKEGDQVRQGQTIASAGKDVDGNPRLYFEIRKDGKPVDPIGYLPKR